MDFIKKKKKQHAGKACYKSNMYNKPEKIWQYMLTE